MNSTERYTSGFTLLEIMIALVILAGGLIMVARASHHILSALGHSRNILRSGILVQERMTDIRGAILMNSQWKPHAESGRFAAPYDGYKWILGISDSQAATMTKKGRLSEVTLRVRRIDGTAIGSGAGFVFQPN